MSAESSRRAHLPHQPALDGIRGVAVVGVLLFHGEKLAGGYLGVDAFFVLSGFLITSLLLAEHGSFGSTSLRTFWVRRARRLFPALLLALVGVALYAWLVADAAELADIRGDGLATLFYVANWREITAGFDYFAIFRSPSPLQHTWSLAIEEQFYLLWPLVFVAATRKRDPARAARRMFAISFAGAIGSFVLAQVLFVEQIPEFSGGHLSRIRQALTEGSANRVYYGTDTRIGAILLGAALAAWISMRGPVRTGRARSVLEIVAWIGAVGLGWAWVTVEGDAIALYRGGLIACGFAVTAVIAAATHPVRGPLARVLSWSPLRGAGLISYGLYLWHWPVYVWLDEARTDLDGWSLLAVRLAVTLVVSLASYRFVERPIRRGWGSTRRMRFLVPVVIVAVVGSLVASTAASPSDAPGPRVRGKGGLLVVGDSVAHSLYSGFVTERFRVRESWGPGCRLLAGELPFENQYSNDCPWRTTFADAIASADPDVVVLSIGVWDLFDLRPPGAESDLIPGTEEWAQYLETSLDDAINILGARGAGVVIPTLPCQRALKGAPGFDEFRSSVDVERVDAWNEVLVDVAARFPGQVATPDLFGYLCPNREFVAYIDEVRVRDDGVHFTEDGAALVARFLGPAIDGVAPRTDRLRLGDGVTQRIVGLYGDSPLAEVASTIGVALVERHDIRLVGRAADGASLCDLLARFQTDLVELDLSLAVLETNGGAFTPCMAGRGRGAVIGSAEYYDQIESDFRTFFSVALDSGVSVLVVAPPPAPATETIAVQQQLWLAARRAAEGFSDVVLIDTARRALGGEQWRATLPCESGENEGDGCVGGQIAVRSPNGSNFCPEGYVPGAPCFVPSSGANRYAGAIVEALLDVLGPPRTDP